MRRHVTNHIRLTQSIAKRVHKIIKKTGFKKPSELVEEALIQYLTYEEKKQEYSKWDKLNANLQYKAYKKLEKENTSLKGEIFDQTIRYTNALDKIKTLSLSHIPS